MFRIEWSASVPFRFLHGVPLNMFSIAFSVPISSPDKMQVAKKAYDEDDGDCGCKAAVIVAITVSRDNVSFGRTAVA